MPSGMVAVPRNDLGSAVDETRSSQWIQSLSSQLIPKWNPRLGRGVAHDAWEFGLSRAVKRARLGHILGFAPPTLKEFKALYAKGSASTDANASYSDACKEHVDGNTMLYDLIVPSITLDASARSYKTDIKDIESLVETTEKRCTQARLRIWIRAGTARRICCTRHPCNQRRRPTGPFTGYPKRARR